MYGVNPVAQQGAGQARESLLRTEQAFERVAG